MSKTKSSDSAIEKALIQEALRLDRLIHIEHGDCVCGARWVPFGTGWAMDHAADCTFIALADRVGDRGVN